MGEIKVLFVSNVPVWGGSVKSLFQTVSLFSKSSIGKAYLLIPKGSASKHFKPVSEVIEVSAIPQFDNTLYGHYRWFRWLLLAREFIAFVKFLFSLKQLKQNFKDVDIIHFNEIVCFVPCVIFLKKICPNAKVVTHVRSLQCNGNNLRTRLVNALLYKMSDHIFCIDNIVQNTLPDSVRDKVTVLYNVNNCSTLNVPIKVKFTGSIRLIFLGGCNYMKGAGFLLPLVSILDLMGVDFSLTVIGIEENKESLFSISLNKVLSILGIKKTISSAEFKESFKEYSLKHEINLLPFQNNIDQYLTSSDLLIFPSYLDAPGRPSIEAMGLGIPSIIFCNDKKNDVVLEGKTGFNIANLDIQQFAERIAYFYKNPNSLEEFSHNCINHYNNVFLPSSHLEKLSSTYTSLLSN
jgi:glycosyltransferase involved in cell wall biosynthesis